MESILASLTEEPKHFADCCCGISLRLISNLLERLPRGGQSSLVLSIGAGSGLLEEILRRKSGGTLNIFGVEVPTCANKYLPDERMLRVSSTTALHSDGIEAEVLIFVYPRQTTLIRDYADGFVRGALRHVLLIMDRNDWIDHFAPILHGAFATVEIVEDAGLPTYEVLATASDPILSPRVSAISGAG